MKKLDFSNPGGLEWANQDAQFIYDSLREALAGSLSWLVGLSPYPIIISGVVVTEAGGNYTYTGGWIYFDEEVIYIPANAVPTVIGAGVYKITIAADTVLVGGTRAPEAPGPHADCWLETRAQVIKTAGAGHVLSDCLRYADALRLAFKEEDWLVVGGGGAAPAYSAGWGGSLKFKLNSFKQVEMIGYADNGGLSVSNEVIVVLPAAYRPAEDKEFALAGLEAGNPSMVLIKVSTTGNVQLSAPIYGTSKRVWANPIRFRLS